MSKQERVYTKQEDWDFHKVLKAIELFSFDGWKFSPSQIGCYRTCSFQYALKYICNMRETHTFLGTLIGTVLHSLQEKRFKEPAWFQDLETSIEKRNEARILAEKLLRDLIEEKNLDGIELRLPKPYSQANKLVARQGNWEQYLVEEASKKIVDWLLVTPAYKVKAENVEREVIGEICGVTFGGFVDFIGEDKSNDTVFGDWKTTYSFNYFKPVAYLNQLAIYSELLKIPIAHMVAFSRHKSDTPPVKVFSVPFTAEKRKSRLYDVGMCVRGITNKVFLKPFDAKKYDWRTKEERVDNNFCHKVCGFRKFCWRY